MAIVDRHEAVIPLLQEVVRLEKRVLDIARVAVRVHTELDEVVVDDTLAADIVDVERVSIGRFVETIPEPRTDGDVTVFPVVEEVIVKRLFLREEVRVTRRRDVTAFQQTVTLRRQVAEVDRTNLQPSTST